eukprot:2036142-Rhodomonas_salina.1
MSDSNFLQSLQQFAKENITDEDCELLAPYTENPLFTVEFAQKGTVFLRHQQSETRYIDTTMVPLQLRLWLRNEIVGIIQHEKGTRDLVALIWAVLLHSLGAGGWAVQVGQGHENLPRDRKGAAKRCSYPPMRCLSAARYC